MVTGIKRGFVSFIVTSILSGACLVFGFAPDEWIAALVTQPPEWLLHPLTKIASLVLGGILGFIVWRFWLKSFVHVTNLSVRGLLQKKQGRMILFLIIMSGLLAIGSIATGVMAYRQAMAINGSQSINVKEQNNQTGMATQEDFDESSLEQISGKRFRNEEIEVDNKFFLRCRFENVTLIYRGTGIVRLEENEIVPPLTIKSPTSIPHGLLIMLKELAGLDATRARINADFDGKWTWIRLDPIPAEEKKEE